MNSLTPDYVQYVRSGIEFVINSTNGEVFFTDAGYCKLSGIPIGRVLDRLDEMQEGTDWHDTHVYTTDGKKSVRVIPAEVIFDWLSVDRPTLDRPILAAKFARETSAVSVYFYRLAGSKIHLLESVKSILEDLMQQKKDIELLKEQWKENAEGLKAQEIFSLKTQEAVNRLLESRTVELTTNKKSCKDSDNEPENLKTQAFFLEVFKVITAAYRLRLGEEIGSEHPYGWLKILDKAELSELIAEIEKDYRLVELEPTACDRIEATIYEWHESAIAIPSPELAAAFSNESDEVLLTKPTSENTEDYLTVWQYLEDVGENHSLNDAIQMNDAAIIFCQNRDIEMREIIRNKLGTVHAFPVSVLKKLDKKRETNFDRDQEHYFTIPQYFNSVPNQQKKISLSDAIMLNALAFNICKEKEIEIKQETFTTLGTMNAFPISVIEQVERYLNQ